MVVNRWMVGMNSQIIEKLWGRNQAPWYGAISTLDRSTNAWNDEFLGDEQWLEFHLMNMAQPTGVDLFFTPLVYENKRRLATQHLPPSILFADLDPVRPADCDPLPHVAWETSTGNYQAVWLLAKPIKYRTQWADLNRRMTYHTGADRGGWSGSKVLRIPGSINYKRGGVRGGVLWENWDDRPYTYALLDHILLSSDEIQSPTEVGEAPAIVSEKAKLDEIWNRMPARIQWMLTRKAVNDRSKFIVSVSHLMAKAEVDKLDAFQMLWHAPYNKWRTRNNPQRLWIELTHAYETR